MDAGGPDGPITGAGDDPARRPTPWTERLEIVALATAAGTVGVVGQSVATAFAYRAEIDVGGLGAGSSEWDVLLPVIAQGGTIEAALALALAYGLVVLTPGRVGRWGRLALNALSVLGAVVAALAALGIEETLRNGANGGFASFGGGDPSDTADLLLRLAGLFAWLPSLAIALAVAWASWRTLNEMLAEADPAPGPFGAPLP